jgi:putative transposase
MSKWHAPEEIGRFLAEVARRSAAGGTVEQVCRELGIGVATYYTWQKRYGRMNPGQLARLKMVEAENARLRKDMAALVLDNAILRETVDAVLSPAQKRMAVRCVQERLSVPERRVCSVLSRSSGARLGRSRDEQVLAAILRLSASHPRAGYRRIAELLRAEGMQVTDKQVYRLRRMLRSPDGTHTTS